MAPASIKSLDSRKATACHGPAICVTAPEVPRVGPRFQHNAPSLLGQKAAYCSLDGKLRSPGTGAASGTETSFDRQP